LICRLPAAYLRRVRRSRGVDVRCRPARDASSFRAHVAPAILKVTGAIRQGDFPAVAVERPRGRSKFAATLTAQLRMSAPMGHQYSRRRMRH
jgi:hypothetical protein